MSKLGVGVGVAFPSRPKGAGGGGLTPAFVRSDITIGVASLTPGATPTNGNTIFLVAGSPVDSAGWTWPSGFTMRVSGNQSGWYMGIAEKVAASESGAYNMGGTFAAGQAAIGLMEFTNVKTTTPFDVSATGGSLATSIALGPTGNTAQATELVVAGSFFGGDISAPAWDSGFTLDKNHARMSMAYKVLSSIQTISVTHTWVTARSAFAALGAWKGA